MKLMKNSEIKDIIFRIGILALWGVAGYFLGGIVALLTH